MFRPLPPKLRIFGVDYYRSFEAQKMVFGSALVIRGIHILLCSVKTLTLNIAIKIAVYLYAFHSPPFLFSTQHGFVHSVIFDQNVIYKRGWSQ